MVSRSSRARHGRGHVLPPSEIDFRANIDALKRSRCDRHPIALRRRQHARGPPTRDFVVIDQFVDRTFARAKSFFGTGPVSRMCRWRTSLSAGSATRLVGAGTRIGMTLKRGGTYLVMEGRNFPPSRRARSWKCDVIGMTICRSKARPRGGDLLRDGGDGHRLRLLAFRGTTPSRSI